MAQNIRPTIPVPSSRNWRAADQNEMNRRGGRKQARNLRLAACDPPQPIFSGVRVHQFGVSRWEKSKPSGRKASLSQPADRSRDFALAAHQMLNGALLRCEERYPNEGPHSVLYVVIERAATQLRAKLQALHKAWFGPGQGDPLAPVRLEVIDRATDEAVQRLIEAGLLARTTRAARPLWLAEATEAAPLPLSAAELETIKTHRQRASRKFKIAGVLDQAGLREEARSALLEGMLPLGCALAVEQRLPEPASVNDALLPPLSPGWKNALPLLHEFVCDDARPCLPVLQALASIAQTVPPSA